MKTCDMRERLAGAIDGAVKRWAAGPAVWGRDDCAMACADVLAPVLGYDPAARWRGRYRTRLGFIRVLRREGFADIAGAVADAAARHGWTEISPFNSRAGDIGILEHDSGQAVCLAMTTGHWIARAETGVAVRVPVQIHKAWSILGDA